MQISVLSGDEQRLALGARLVCVWLDLGRRGGGVGHARHSDRVERAAKLPGGETLLSAHVPQLRGAVTGARYSTSIPVQENATTHKLRCGLAQSGRSPAYEVSGVHSSTVGIVLTRPMRDPSGPLHRILQWQTIS